jgi:hypothetical protein
MIYFQDNKYSFYSNKVTFLSSEDGQQSAYCNDVNLYLDMVKNYSWKFSNLVSTQVIPTEEQKARLELLNSIEVQHKNTYESECVLFVEHGAILPDSHSTFLLEMQEEYQTLTTAYIDSNIKLKLWYKVKEERDHRTQHGGYKVGTKWYHSDTFSRSQQLGLVLLGGNIPQGLMWKTMDGSFVEMTPALAQQIFQAATASDTAIFEYAEILNQQIQSSDNPESIDIKVGWPETYQP